MNLWSEMLPSGAEHLLQLHWLWPGNVHAVFGQIASDRKAIRYVYADSYADSDAGGTHVRAVPPDQSLQTTLDQLGRHAALVEAVLILEAMGPTDYAKSARRITIWIR